MNITGKRWAENTTDYLVKIVQNKVFKAKFEGGVFSVLFCTLHELDSTGRSIYCLNKRIVEDGYATEIDAINGKIKNSEQLSPRKMQKSLDRLTKRSTTFLDTNNRDSSLSKLSRTETLEQQLFQQQPKNKYKNVNIKPDSRIPTRKKSEKKILRLNKN